MLLHIQEFRKKNEQFALELHLVIAEINWNWLNSDM